MFKKLFTAASLLALSVISTVPAFAFTKAEMSEINSQITNTVVKIGEFCSGNIIYSGVKKVPTWLTVKEKESQKKHNITIVLTAKHCTNTGDELYKIVIPEYNKENITVRETTYLAEVYKTSYKSDVAFLKLLDKETTFDNVAKIAGADTDMYFGRDAYIVANPLSHGITITKGNLGYKERIDYPKNNTIYQKATPNIAPGSSGSGLFVKNEDSGDYELAGITSIGIRGFPFIGGFMTLDAVRADLPIELED